MNITAVVERVAEKIVVILPGLIQEAMGEEGGVLSLEAKQAKLVQETVHISVGDILQFADDPDHVYVSHPIGQIVHEGLDMLTHPNKSDNHGYGIRYDAEVESLRVYAKGLREVVLFCGYPVRLNPNPATLHRWLEGKLGVADFRRILVQKQATDTSSHQSRIDRLDQLSA